MRSLATLQILTQNRQIGMMMWATTTVPLSLCLECLMASLILSQFLNVLGIPSQFTNIQIDPLHLLCYRCYTYAGTIFHWTKRLTLDTKNALLGSCITGYRGNLLTMSLADSAVCLKACCLLKCSHIFISYLFNNWSRNRFPQVSLFLTTLKTDSSLDLCPQRIYKSWLEPICLRYS